MTVSSLTQQTSAKLSREIARVIPGGVDSPFRSFAEVGGHTIFFDRASGSKLIDVDGNTYIDYLGAWGPAILGHCPQEVVTACQETLSYGPVLGAPHELELKLAEKLTEIIPGLKMVRFVNSGTEAVMSAIRLARGCTRRDLIVMFEGCYHGHSDVVLASRSHRASAGIPEPVASCTLVVPFNNLEALESCLKANRQEIAAVIIEPVAGSMGVIPPDPGYLEGVRNLCTRYGVLLIFDEVLTGIRIARGGAQEFYGVTADLVCLGKALGGGMPIGAYGGSDELMQQLLPEGNVYQAGTFSGNPVTMAGGLKTLELLAQPGIYDTLEAKTAQLFEGLSPVTKTFKISLQRVGSMFGILFAPKPVRNYQDSLTIDNRAFAAFFHELLKHGIYLPPSAVDAACVSAAHSEQDIEETVKACVKALTLRI